jgi:1,2-diacylglycerol 3-beta-galactosyltransferase
MGAPALTSVLRRRRQSLPYYTAVTDYGSLHIWWAFPFGEAWFAPSPETAAELISAGVPARRVIVSGYPVHPRFALPPAPREEARRALGLDAGRFTALLVGGAEGVGPLQEIVEALALSPAPWQLVVICGYNEALRERLAGRAGRWAVPVRVEGHVDDMPARMHVADLLLTKAGGSTLSEGLACGLPMLLVNVLPGQEEGNARHFVSLGVAQRLAAPDEARAILARLAAPGSPELQAMAARARAAARPEASREIARQVLERGTAVTAAPIPPLFGVRLLRSRAERRR